MSEIKYELARICEEIWGPKNNGTVYMSSNTEDLKSMIKFSYYYSCDLLPDEEAFKSMLDKVMEENTVYGFCVYYSEWDNTKYLDLLLMNNMMEGADVTPSCYEFNVYYLDESKGYTDCFFKKSEDGRIFRVA